MQRFKNILVYLDPAGSGPDIALTEAAKLASQNDARLTVVTVFANPSSTFEQASDPNWDFLEIMLTETSKQLDRRVSELVREGLKLKTKALVGSPAEELVREVIRHDHDLVMKTARPDRHHDGMSFGTIALRLMRKCPCPVWIVQPTKHETYRRVLAAVDPATDDNHPDLNQKVLELGLSLSHQEQSEFHVLHTWEAYGERLLDSRLSKEEFGQFMSNAKSAQQSRYQKALEPFSKRIRENWIHFQKGEPHYLIPKFADNHEIDVIVMGTVARTGVAGFLMGNTAERVLKKIRCSILAIKPDAFVTPVTLEDE